MEIISEVIACVKPVYFILRIYFGIFTIKNILTEIRSSFMFIKRADAIESKRKYWALQCKMYKKSVEQWIGLSLFVDGVTSAIVKKFPIIRCFGPVESFRLNKNYENDS